MIGLIYSTSKDLQSESLDSTKIDEQREERIFII